MKAYDDPAVVKLLSLLGAGFDCASKVNFCNVNEIVSCIKTIVLERYLSVSCRQI